jgi:peptide/nickel transport system permease protein
MISFTYVAKRLLQMIPTFLVVMIVIFTLIRLIPGDPASALLGDRASDAAVARKYQQLGLDKPVVVQFKIFVVNLLKGDLGDSIVLKRPVLEIVGERLPVTLFLTAYSAILAALMALPLAILAALNRDRMFDHCVRIVAQIGLSSPVFFVGLILLTFLGAKLRWFPVGGYGDGFVQNLYFLFLPALTLALFQSAILLRNLRSSIIEVLDAGYVDFAKAKGLRRRVLLTRYVLRNALIPTINLFGLSMGFLIGGAVITETVFAIPGAGRLMVESIFGRDYPVVQGLTLFLALLVSVVFLITDLMLAWLDPRGGQKS